MMRRTRGPLSASSVRQREVAATLIYVQRDQTRAAASGMHNKISIHPIRDRSECVVAAGRVLLPSDLESSQGCVSLISLR